MNAQITSATTTYTDGYTDQDVDRFADKVDFPPEGPDNTVDCWHWQGARHSKRRGYGKFWLGGRVLNAHKASHLLFKGPVEDGLVVAHLCNCETCVNPYHLEAQTQSQNMQYAVDCGRHNSCH